jgi:hypothetical protein
VVSQTLPCRWLAVTQEREAAREEETARRPNKLCPSSVLSPGDLVGVLRRDQIVIINVPRQRAVGFATEALDSARVQVPDTLYVPAQPASPWHSGGDAWQTEFVQ